MPHRTSITSEGSVVVGVQACGGWDHVRTIVLLLLFPVEAVEDGQIRQVELHGVTIVYEVADGIGALRLIAGLLECEGVQVCELRELPDVRQLANVIVGEVEDFEHRDLGELPERHE